ncbi:MAG: hypothetical protein H6719_16040 [Sandaracinaceae bacterium]|nr:hypothetical protein [Sandaracinaceae bacterium]
MLRRCGLLSLTLLVACGGDRGQESTPPRATTADDEAPPTCTVPGTEGAHAVPLFIPPEGCSFSTSGSPSAPQVVHSAEELAAVLTCTGDAPTIDLEANDLYVYSFSMSPAYGGGEIFDDGAVVTIAQRDRPPCPNDPMAMPMSAQRAFLLPADATRTFRQAACTLPARCP